MLRFLKKIFNSKQSRERKIILESFPRSLTKDVKCVLDLLEFTDYPIGHHNEFKAIIHNEEFAITYRVNFKELSPLQILGLSKIQKSIVYCIYSRHTDGYIREKMLRKLINCEEDFVVPYILRLSGEYVLELINIIIETMDEEKLQRYNRFYKTNQSSFKKLEMRMISYWNEFYRKEYSLLRKYPGKILLNRIKFYGS